MGFRVQGSGFCLGFSIGFRVYSLGFGFQSLEFRAWISEFRVESLGLGFGVQALSSWFSIAFGAHAWGRRGACARARHRLSTSSIT